MKSSISCRFVFNVKKIIQAQAFVRVCQFIGFFSCGQARFPCRLMQRKHMSGTGLPVFENNVCVRDVRFKRVRGDVIVRTSDGNSTILGEV